jgi:integrase
MAQGAITLRSVQALRPGATLWDAALPGFGARRQRSAVAYVLKYRVLGRQRFVTLGRHGALTPDQARRKAKALLGQVAGGTDPAALRAEAKAQAADTLGRVAADYLQFAAQRQKPRTFVSTKRHLLVNWRPLHGVSIFHIRRRDVADRLGRIEAEHGPSTAIRARAALSAMFVWAIRRGFEIEANPVLGTHRPAAPKSRDRVLSDAELAEVWQACEAGGDYGRIVRLLMLTAQRRDEVGGMQRSEIDGDVWVIPGERTKNKREHAVPLAPAALAIVTDAARLTNRDWLFGRGPRREGDRQGGFSGWSKAKTALDARIGHPTEWRLHDLRRTAATVMADRLGVLPHIIEAVLNHVSGHRAGVAGVYNRARYAGEMRVALERWAEHVVALVC